MELIYHELSSYFGASPPSTHEVKKALKSIVEKKIKIDNINLED